MFRVLCRGHGVPLASVTLTLRWFQHWFQHVLTPSPVLHRVPSASRLVFRTEVMAEPNELVVLDQALLSFTYSSS